MEKIVLVTLLLMSVWVGKAQWTFTPEVGMNITKYEHSETAKIGARVGVAVEYQLPRTEFFSIRSGLYFLQCRYNNMYLNNTVYYGGYYGGGYSSYYPYGSAGYQGIYDAGSYVYGDYNSSQTYLNKTETTKNYLQLPVLANFHWNVCENIKITAGVGPYIAYSIGGKSRGTQYVYLPEGGMYTHHTEQGSFSDMEFISSDGSHYYRPGDKRFDWGGYCYSGHTGQTILGKSGI